MHQCLLEYCSEKDVLCILKEFYIFFHQLKANIPPLSPPPSPLLPSLPPSQASQTAQSMGQVLVEGQLVGPGPSLAVPALAEGQAAGSGQRGRSVLDGSTGLLQVRLEGGSLKSTFSDTCFHIDL